MEAIKNINVRNSRYDFSLFLETKLDGTIFIKPVMK